MALNNENCEMVFFTINLHEARWQPTIPLEDQPQHLWESNGRHVANITAKVASRCRVVTLMTSKQWGWRNGQLTKIYMAYTLVS